MCRFLPLVLTAMLAIISVARPAAAGETIEFPSEDDLMITAGDPGNLAKI